MMRPAIHYTGGAKEIAGISFYTPCMNRTSFLKQTLPKNLEALKNIQNVEFVVLNYNSKDDLDDFMKSFQKEMDIGRLSYYKENTREKYHHSHAYNMASRLCIKKIICVTNADYFVSLEWYEFVINNMKKNYFIYNEYSGDATGRNAFWKKDFEKLGGFDEKMCEWGYEDTDMYNRAKIMGLNGISLVNKKQFWNCISHSWDIRCQNHNWDNENIAKNRSPNTFKINPDGFGKGIIIEKNLQKVKIELR